MPASSSDVDGRLDLLAHRHQLFGRGIGPQPVGIAGVLAVADLFGDVTTGIAQDRLDQQPLRAVDVRLDQAALEGVLPVAGRHIVAIVERDTLADIEGVGQAIFRDAAVLHGRDLGGQHRHVLGHLLAVEEDQRPPSRS